MKTILITGGCGFVGSNLAINFKRDYPDTRIIAFDNLKRMGSELNISRLREIGVEFMHGDIRNKEDFNEIGEISTLIEAAAEPSVLSGINSTTDYVINTNLLGTINCLNFAVKHKANFIFLSTSRIYPVSSLNEILYENGETRFNILNNQNIPGVSKNGINEKFPINGFRSFYGTSKLSSEQFIQEYAEFYGLKSVINRCGVITGPWQMGKIDQGVVVLWLAKHYWKKELSYIGFGGEGKQLRDIIHVSDLYKLIKIQMNDIDKYNKEIYNVGGGENISVSLRELTSLCEEITGNNIKIKSIAENRIADIPLYITDNSKITSVSGWKPEISAKEILIDVFEWINANETNLKKILN
ncbi:MAG: NAD-dependent epimerase/dehydratase family protein [Bacteroidetes bacterium]|nr:NAD-dependent epimerase/dehydratase family protein [Bacteroidota bacterium]HET6244981.1 NAD-dependent epimerase/dehydratase family protein [Bacteroidia bacterium]